MDGEPSLDIIDEPEVLSSLLNLDDVHESSREPCVGANLAVNLDETLLEDVLDLLGGEGVPESNSHKVSLTESRFFLIDLT